MLLAHSLRRPVRLPRLLPLAPPSPPPLAPHSPPPPGPLVRSPLCLSLRCLHSSELWSRLNNRPELATSRRRCLPKERPSLDGWAERATSLRRFRLPVALACLSRPRVAIGALNGVIAIGALHGVTAIGIAPSNCVTVTDVGALQRSMRMGIHVAAGIRAGVTVVSVRGNARGGIVRGRGKKGIVKEGEVKEGSGREGSVRAWRVAEERVITKRLSVERVAVARKNSTVEVVVAEAAESEAAAVQAKQRRGRKPKHDKEKDPENPEQAAEDAYSEDGPLPVVILLDFETTGQGTTQNRIVELALRDVAGGRGAALHTLVNPFPRHISSEAERIHGISMRMVNRPSVPHWPAAGQLLVDFVEARRVAQAEWAAQAERAAVSVHSTATTGVYVNTEAGAGMRMGMSAEMTQMSAVSSAAPLLLPPVVLVAHNGWSFDFPLLHNELQRVGIAVPPGWHSLDSMRLVQRLFKDTDRKPASKALGFLYSTHFCCSTPFAHPDLAHRAMADVDKLAEVLAAAMWERGVTVQQLLQYTKPFL
ncbi:unnamed protein product [Closterium sp. NIES-54]